MSDQKVMTVYIPAGTNKESVGKIVLFLERQLVVNKNLSGYTFSIVESDSQRVLVDGYHEDAYTHQYLHRALNSLL